MARSGREHKLRSSTYVDFFNDDELQPLTVVDSGTISFVSPLQAEVLPVLARCHPNSPSACCTTIQEPTYLPPPIFRDVSMELPKSLHSAASPARSSLTPQPGSPL
jgi:hypothetical protein